MLEHLPLPRFRNEAQPVQEVEPWVQTAELMPFWRKHTAEKAFALAVRRSAVAEVPRVIQSIMAPRDPQLDAQYDSAVTARMRQLLEEPQPVEVGQNPSRLDRTATSLQRERNEIYAQVAEMSDDSFGHFERRLEKQERKLPEEQKTLMEGKITPLSVWQEINERLPENRKAIAEMIFASTLMNALLRDARAHIPHRKLHRRDVITVEQDLRGLLQAYDQLQEGNMPKEGTSEHGYYKRVRPLLAELNDQKNNIYRSVERIPEEDMKVFESSAEQAVNVMKKRLRGPQQDLLAERAKVSLEDIEHAYRFAFRKNAGMFAVDNILAAGAGYLTMRYLHASPEFFNVAGPASEGALVGTTAIVGSTAIAKLIEETGLSLSVAALAMRDAVSSVTDNRLLKNVGIGIGHTITKYASDQAVWATTLSGLYGSGAISFKDVLAIVLGANVSGTLWEGATALISKHMRKKTKQERQLQRQERLTRSEVLAEPVSAVPDEIITEELTQGGTKGGVAEKSLAASGANGGTAA